MIDSLYGAEYFEKELRKRKKRIADLEERLSFTVRDLKQKIADEREAYRKLIYQKAGWEWRLSHIIENSTKTNVEL